MTHLIGYCYCLLNNYLHRLVIICARSVVKKFDSLSFIIYFFVNVFYITKPPPKELLGNNELGLICNPVLILGRQYSVSTQLEKPIYH